MKINDEIQLKDQIPLTGCKFFVAQITTCDVYSALLGFHQKLLLDLNLISFLKPR